MAKVENSDIMYRVDFEDDCCSECRELQEFTDDVFEKHIANDKNIVAIKALAYDTIVIYNDGSFRLLIERFIRDE